MSGDSQIRREARRVATPFGDDEVLLNPFNVRNGACAYPRPCGAESKVFWAVARGRRADPRKAEIWREAYLAECERLGEEMLEAEAGRIEEIEW